MDMETRELQLAEKHGGTWGAHPNHPVADWQYEVANDDVRCSYWRWVLDRVEAEEAEDRAELLSERDRLLKQLQAAGGRGVELAEEIDELSRQLGEGEEAQPEDEA